MITLNGERGLQRVESWDDVLGIPGFTACVDPRRHKLGSIIGKYSLSEMVPCGLTTCRTPHGRGFVVALAEGLVSNIGKDCGKTHFGVDFETMSRAFDQAVRTQDWRERITAFQNTIPGLLDRISRLRSDQQGDWVYKTSRAFLSTSCPQAVRDSLSTMIRAQDGRLMRSRLETEAEALTREVMQGSEIGQDQGHDRAPRRQYIDEQIGLIDGLGAFDPELDLRSLLVLQALPQLKTIKELVVQNLTERELRAHVKWIEGVDGMFHKAERAIVEGSKFLRKANVTQLRKLLSAATEFRVFDRLVCDLPP